MMGHQSTSGKTELLRALSSSENSSTHVSRRRALFTGATFAMAHSGLGSAAAQPVQQSSELDLSPGRATLNAFMKLQTSISEQDIYYWYSGAYDGSLFGRSLSSMIGFQAIVKRRVSKPAEGLFHVTTWEAFYFHPLGDRTPIDGVYVNPLDGREVRPFHHKEGPTTFVYSEQSPRILGSDILNRPEKTLFEMPWSVSGNSVWMQRETFLDIPHFWNDEQRKSRADEVSQDRIRYSSIGTHFGRIDELLDEDIQSASSLFNYQATCDFLPWFKLANVPGAMIWRANGLKFQEVGKMPSEILAAFEKIHPEIFEDIPWSSFRTLFHDYLEQVDP